MAVGQKRTQLQHSVGTIVSVGMLSFSRGRHDYDACLINTIIICDRSVVVSLPTLKNKH